MPLQITDLQAHQLLTNKGFELLSKSIATHGSNKIGGQLDLSTFDNIPDPALAAGSILYFEEHIVHPIEDILNANGMSAYKLLIRNYQIQSEVVRTVLTQQLIAKSTQIRIVASFGLFGSLLADAEEESDPECILTPAAMLITKERVSKNMTSLFELFQVYIDTETEHSFAPVMEFILRTMHVSDLKFSTVFHRRVLPVFVQMIRGIPETDLIALRTRFDSWMAANVVKEDIEYFGTVAIGALQGFYGQLLDKSDWPK